MAVTNTQRIDQVVTVAATTAAVLISPVLMVWAGSDALVPAVFGMAYAVLGAVLLLARRPSTDVMLNAAAFALAGSLLISPNPSLRPLVHLVAVVLPVVGATSSKTWWRSIVFFAPVLAISEALGSTEPFAIRSIELVGSLIVMVTASWVAARLSRDAGVATARAEALFEQSPIPSWDVDLSGVVQGLNEIRAAGVSDLRAWLDADPRRLGVLAQRAVIRRPNPAAARMIARIGDPTREYFGLLDIERAVPLIRDELEMLWSGALESSRELHIPGPSPRWILQSWAVAQHRGRPDYSTVIATAADLTAQKQAAEFLERQVQMKDEFIAAVSHELRTPLAVVVGLSAELRESPEAFTGEERGELVELIASQSTDVAYIVEDLLVAARIDSGDITVIPEMIDVADTITDLLDHVAVGEMPLGVHAFADPYRVRQVVRNLLTNAMRYGGPNRSVALGTGADGVHIDVVDDGPGIPPQMVATVFEAYGRATLSATERMSVGLGLTISRELARLMGGSLTYQREHGRTVFRLWIPAEPRTESNNSLDPTTVSRIG